MANEEDIATLELDYETQTENAILFTDGNKEIWIPKSIVINANEFEELDEETSGCSVEIPYWFAYKKGLI